MDNKSFPATPIKHLLVTGDDFGANHRVNEAIERDHRAGWLTQASLMVDAPAVEEAVRIARRNPALGIGLHLTLCAGTSGRVSPLTDAQKSFSPSPARAGLRYFFSKKLHPELSAEIEAQFARFLSLGFQPVYWDGHAHLHLHPTILRLTLPIAAAHGFGATRLVREPRSAKTLPLIFRLLSQYAISQFKENRIMFCDEVFGLSRTGKIDDDYCRRTLTKLTPGWTEFYYHPGAEPRDLDANALVQFAEKANVKFAYAGDLINEQCA